MKQVNFTAKQINFATSYPITGFRLLKCPVYDKQPMNANELKEHFAEMNDNAHILYEVMNS